MKSIVKTSGSFSLIDAVNMQEIVKNRPVVVEVTTFIEQRAATGDLMILANGIPEEALDKDLLDFWKESKKKDDLAVASYLDFLTPKKPVKKES